VAAPTSKVNGPEARVWALRELVVPAGRYRGPVDSGSMMPWARPGDHYIIETAGGDDVKPGDVVLAVVGARPVTHRVIARRPGDTLILKGDCNRFRDPPVAAADVIGRVVALETAPGRVVIARPAAARLLATCSRLHAAFPFLNFFFYLARRAVVVAFRLRG
jgi:signal peptidase I